MLGHVGVAKACNIVVFKQRGAVDHRIDLAQLLHHARQQLARGRFVGQIGLKNKCLRAE